MSRGLAEQATQLLEAGVVEEVDRAVARCLHEGETALIGGARANSGIFGEGVEARLEQAAEECLSRGCLADSYSRMKAELDEKREQYDRLAQWVGLE